MIAQICRVTALVALAALFTACSTTPPSRHYLLTATLDEIPASQSPAIGVGPIEIPEYLNRNTLVYRGQDNELEITHQSRWGEPLEDGISRVVSLNLAGLVGTENVRSFPWHPQRPPDYGVKIRILRMDATDSEAILIAEWVIYKPDEPGNEQRNISQQTLPLTPSKPVPAQMPGALSTLLFKLSEKIAASISRAEPAR
jgi:uncharacterized lipoprotein YmbA